MSRIVARLTFPDGRSERLSWVQDHAMSSYDMGVVLRAKTGAVLDGAAFRVLRDSHGARIETSDPARIAWALSVPWQNDVREPGIGPLT